MLELPAGKLGGYQIRIDSELLGPRDRLWIWYGRDGMLQMSSVFVSDAIDENGNHVGTLFTQTETSLESFNLENQPRSGPE